jgi:hypothetical protein
MGLRKLRQIKIFIIIYCKNIGGMVIFVYEVKWNFKELKCQIKKVGQATKIFLKHY